MEAKRYRKKPTTIEAVQYTGDNAVALEGWAGPETLPDAGVTTGAQVVPGTTAPGPRFLTVMTPTGGSSLTPGDWLARQPMPDGTWDYWPIAQAQFEATYEPVPDE